MTSTFIAASRLGWRLSSLVLMAVLLFLALALASISSAMAQQCATSNDCEFEVDYCGEDNNCYPCNECPIYDDEIDGIPCGDVCPSHANATSCLSSGDCEPSIDYCGEGNYCYPCNECTIYKDEINGLHCGDVCPSHANATSCLSSGDCESGVNYCDEYKNCYACDECSSYEDEINGIPCAVVCHKCLSSGDCEFGIDYCGGNNTCYPCNDCTLYKDEINGFSCSDVCPSPANATGCMSSNDCASGVDYCDEYSNCYSCNECAMYEDEINGIPCADACKVCERLTLMPNMTSLDLSNQGLRTEDLLCIFARNDFPHDALLTLKLNGNRITSIDGVQWPTNLTTLSFDSNKITSMDNQQWPSNLTTLFFFNNQITSIDNQNWPASLTTLDLGTNLITSIDNQQWPTNLTALFLDINQITSIDNQNWPASLTSLYLFENRIMSIDNQNWPMQLTILPLAGNQITSIDNQNWPQALEQLYLHNNEITSIDDQNWPTPLRLLNLGENLIDRIVNQTWPASLDRLRLTSNPITMIVNSPWPSQLDFLNLRDTQLSTIDNQTWPSTLTILFLQDCAISSIDNQQWPDSLQYLSLDDNRITSIDNQQWPNALIGLYLDGNELTALGNQHWPSSLEILHLQENRITSVTDQVWPSSVTELSLQLNRIQSFNASTLPGSIETFTISNNVLSAWDGHADHLASIAELDLSSNSIQTLPATTAAWPPNLQTLNLANNLFETVEDINAASLPISVTSVNLDFNPLSAWFEASVTSSAGDTVLAELTSQLPCSVSEFSLQHTLLPWNCAAQQLSASSLADLSNATCRAPASFSEYEDYNEWVCTLNVLGEAAIQSTDSFRQYSFSQTDSRYVPFYNYVFIACGVPTVLFVLFSASSFGVRRIDWFLALLLFLASFDLASDWAFYLIEISSDGFREAYNCENTEPVYGCSATDAIYSCEGFANLHSSCGLRHPNELPNSANECECVGFRCAQVGTSPVLCNLETQGNFYTSNAASCTSYGPRDDFVNDTCGYALSTNPNATGANECECFGYTCEIRFQAGCKGWYGGDYTALRYTCFAACIAASVVFLAGWFLKLREMVDVKSRAPEAEPSPQSERLAKLVPYLSISALLIEDIPLLSFQLIYISVLDVTNNSLILATLISTVGGILLTCLFLANREGEFLKKKGWIFGRAFVFVFTLGGAIPKAAEKRKRRRAKRANQMAMQSGYEGKVEQTTLTNNPTFDLNSEAKHDDLAVGSTCDPLARWSEAEIEAEIEGDSTSDDGEYLTVFSEEPSAALELGGGKGTGSERDEEGQSLEQSDGEKKKGGCADCIEDSVEFLLGGLALAIVGFEFV